MRSKLIYFVLLVFNVFSRRNLSHLPASSSTVARFLISKAESSSSVSSSLMARSSITYYHRLIYPEDQPPTDTFLVHRVVRALKEKFAKPVKKVSNF